MAALATADLQSGRTRTLLLIDTRYEAGRASATVTSQAPQTAAERPSRTLISISGSDSYDPYHARLQLVIGVGQRLPAFIQGRTAFLGPQYYPDRDRPSSAMPYSTVNALFLLCLLAPGERALPLRPAAVAKLRLEPILALSVGAPFGVLSAAPSVSKEHEMAIVANSRERYEKLQSLTQVKRGSCSSQLIWCPADI